MVFDQVREDPPEATVLAAADLGRSQGVDGVLAVGGGSSMDVAVRSWPCCGNQALAQLYGACGQCQRRAAATGAGAHHGGDRSRGDPVAAGITTGETTSRACRHRYCSPDVAVLDADLTLGLLAAVTAMTGVDAMVHAIEAYTSRHRKNPLSDNLARQALPLLSRNIRTAVHEGRNREARENMLGACLAGQAFANAAPVAAVHALAYPSWALPHPPRLSNSPGAADGAGVHPPVASGLYAELAEIVVGRPVAGSAEARSMAMRIDTLRELIDDVALPATPQAAGVEEGSLRCSPRMAMPQQRLLVNNPWMWPYEMPRDLLAPPAECGVSPAGPPLRGDYRVFYPISTRWSDNDIYGHVNNVTYYSYFDTAANRYLIEEGLRYQCRGHRRLCGQPEGREYHANSLSRAHRGRSAGGATGR
ncbi:MAG: iron-containing alcohol dehydrogenase [Halioglobus sp.]